MDLSRSTTVGAKGYVAPAELRQAVHALVARLGEVRASQILGVDRLSLPRIVAGFSCQRSLIFAVSAALDAYLTAEKEVGAGKAAA